jgi:hypothetical protein
LASPEPRLQALAAARVSPWMRWYLLNRARGRDWRDLAPRLRRRATVKRLRAHPSDLSRLAEEAEVVRTGVSAAREHGLDVEASGVLEAYVSAEALPRLTRRYLLEPSESLNVIVHVVSGAWPFPAGMRVAPAHVVALDLHDSGDQRTQRAAAAFFNRQLPA